MKIFNCLLLIGLIIFSGCQSTDSKIHVIKLNNTTYESSFTNESYVWEDFIFSNEAVNE
jgi:hypothetical protein